MENSVAIIGMGARYPGANDIVGFRRMVERGTVHVQPVPAKRWDHRFVHSAERRQANKTPATCGAFMEDFDQFAPEFFGITPKRARIMDPQQRLVLEITRQALEDAGYATRPLANRKVGVYVGATSSDHRSLVAAPVNAAVDLAGRIGVAPPLDEATKAAVTAALPPMQAYSMVGQQLNMIAANVSQAFDFSGPAFAIDTACSSALAALHEAVVHLRAGIVDGAVVSGVYVQLDPTMMVCFSRVGALSPTDACRPFQSDADGFVLGEGVGAVVLKRLADAERDGDRIIAVVRGIAMNNDGRGAGPLTPSAAGQSEAIEQAWRDAACDPATVGLLEAHATGTDAGDRIELEALRKVFGGRVRAPVPISSIKASIGHGIASAGIASLIKAALAVESARILPQHVKGELRPELREAQAWLRVPRERETWRGEQRRAGVSAFGFGGTNVHVVLEAAAEPRTGGAEKAEWRFEFSASAAELLDEYLRQVAAAVEEQALPLRDVAYTLATRRRDRVRTSFVAETPTQFAAGIAAARAAVAAGSPLPETTAGQAGAGQRVTLPPSPLPQRRFWLIDPGKRAAAALTPSRDSHAKESTSDAPAPHAAGVDGLGLVVAAVVAVTAWSPDEVKPDRRFVADLGFDSLTTLELMMVLGRSLPGMTPPPRTLFTPALTVGGLAEYLQQSAVAQTGRVPGHVHVFEISRHPWLHEHRPAGRPLLPMSGLVEAALTALAARLGHAVGLAEFKVLAPVEIAGDRIALQVEITEDFTFTVRAEHGGAVLATGAAAETAGPVPALMVGDTVPGPLPLATFYGEFGFHGPALRGLRAPPRLGRPRRRV